MLDVYSFENIPIMMVCHKSDCGAILGNIPVTSIPGTFTYTNASGTIIPQDGTFVMSAGQDQTLNVAFVPTDTANYTSCSGTNTINVSQYQASISWPPIANITYPTPLSGTQLNAVAN